MSEKIRAVVKRVIRENPDKFAQAISKPGHLEWFVARAMQGFKGETLIVVVRSIVLSEALAAARLAGKLEGLREASDIVEPYSRLSSLHNYGSSVTRAERHAMEQAKFAVLEIEDRIAEIEKGARDD